MVKLPLTPEGAFTVKAEVVNGGQTAVHASPFGSRV
jgi:hypothetical protein